MSARINNFRRGDTFLLKFNFGTGVNITGWTLTFTLRDTFKTEIAACSLTRTAGDHVLDELNNGIFYYFFDNETSKSLIPKKYKYDLQLVIPGNPKQVKTLIPEIDDVYEPIEVFPDVTWVE